VRCRSCNHLSSPRSVGTCRPHLGNDITAPLNYYRQTFNWYVNCNIRNCQTTINCLIAFLIECLLAWILRILSNSSGERLGSFIYIKSPPYYRYILIFYICASFIFECSSILYSALTCTFKLFLSIYIYIIIITCHLYSAAKCKKRHTALKIKVQYMKMNEIIETPKLVCSGIK